MKFLVFSAFILLTFACERVTTADGTVPAEYLHLAGRYVGHYHGNFEGRPGTLSLTLAGNKPVLTFVADNGETDLIGVGCNSNINQLAAINPEKRNNEIRVDSAEFAFNGGNCPVLEKNLLIDFKHEGDLPMKMEVNILSRYEVEMRTICFPDGSGRQHCRQESWNVPIYYSGSFKRQ